ncbi:MAG: SAM-dependent methyltransferase [Treponema sp.]|jgi:hypothetical protein|nr:SAM-dependent methyltransferase [Treponema sp.]
MDASASNSFGTLTIGAVFTPAEWAEFAVNEFGLLDSWLSGKTIFDPTMGDGSLLVSLVNVAIKKGYTVSQLPFDRLYGMELHEGYYNKALETFKSDYAIDMRNNFFLGDVLALKDFSADTLFGNPPWCNYVDLPEAYKKHIKSFFYEYGLIKNARKVLLGNSRIDIAALIIQKTIVDNLSENGKAVFFLPLSLFLNEGAHTMFREYSAKNITYSVSSIYDFKGVDAFPNIATRYGLAAFERNAMKTRRTRTEIPYYRFDGYTWVQYRGISQKTGGPLLIPDGLHDVVTIPEILVSRGTKPRQGINPCGTIDVFVFKHYERVDDYYCRVNNTYTLPKKYVYPLITSPNFGASKVDANETPLKWVLLPYNEHTGKPLTATELNNETELLNYLQEYQSMLTNRKGTLIQGYIKRGMWWALLGVGAYNFVNYKIVWEAYGKRTFNPRLFSGRWQANQSLQAFIPCSSRDRAEQLLAQLSNPLIETYLRSSKMEGTMSWAQPGRITAILKYNTIQEKLFG